MRSPTSGILAGVLAGIVMGFGMQMMTAPTPTGGRIPMLEMIADIPLRYAGSGLEGYSKLAVGWTYHLINSAIIGGLYALVLGGLILMPVLLGMPAFAPLMMPPMRPVAMGSLMGHLMYGLILGVVYVWQARALTRRGVEVADSARRRPA